MNAKQWYQRFNIALYINFQFLGLSLCSLLSIMAIANASLALLRPRNGSPLLPKSSLPCALTLYRKSTASLRLGPCFGAKTRVDHENDVVEAEMGVVDTNETVLYSFTPLPLLFVAALPGAGTVRSLFAPFVEIVKSFDLPAWLVHWGHPGNMAVVLFAMGGYGTYLGFRIKYSDNVEEKANAKDLHPKLLAGMFFFFALGATGGVTSLLTSDRPIFESPHAVTGLIGLSLLTVQAILPKLFEGSPSLRNVHGILGSGIMTLFLIHAALGLQLGLTY